MNYLITHFEAFANRYMEVLVEGYMLLVVVLLAYWLRPFVEKKPAVYVSAAVYYILQTINNHMGTSKEMDRLLAVGIILFTILVLWLLDNRRNPVQKIFLILLFRLISWLSMEVCSEIGFYERDVIVRFAWYGNSIEATVLEFFIWNILAYGLALFLLYLVVRILHKAYQSKADELTWQEFVMLLAPTWTLLLVKPIMSSYFLLWMKGIESGTIQENIPANPYRMLFCICSFLSIVTVVTLYQKLKEKQEEEFVRQSVAKQIGDTHRHIDHVEELYERMRGMRHDMGNHLMVIERLTESGNTEELAEYIRAFRDGFLALQPTVKSGNAVTDVLLSEIAARCEKEQIAFESGFVYPDSLDINPFDMSVILTNALQNAIEASETVADPQIRIKSVHKEQVFLIHVRNKISDKVTLKEDGLPKTNKREAGHGYGLKNIKSIARKYKGDIEIRQEESDGADFFVLNIMLVG